MKNWKTKDVEKITKEKIKPRSGIKIPNTKPAGILFIKNHLTLLNIPFVEEYRFHHKRLYRFDIALPEFKIAIEYEGLMSSKSRHTTINGYTEDANKYNLAAIDGWTVLRYTALNYKKFTNDFKSLGHGL